METREECPKMEHLDNHSGNSSTLLELAAELLIFPNQKHSIRLAKSPSPKSCLRRLESCRVFSE